MPPTACYFLKNIIFQKYQGRYLITPGGLTSGNYDIAYRDGILIVETAPLLPSQPPPEISALEIETVSLADPAQAFADIEPAAGGETESNGDGVKKEDDISCANAFLAGVPCSRI